MSDFDWEPPKDAKVIIVCAANKYGDFIALGARHFDNVMHTQIQAVWPNNHFRKQVCSMMEQGFIDQWGRFYTREDAFKIVQENGQPFNAERNGGNGKDLYSEGLY